MDSGEYDFVSDEGIFSQKEKEKESDDNDDNDPWEINLIASINIIIIIEKK